MIILFVARTSCLINAISKTFLVFFFFFALSPILKTEDWLSPQIFGAGCGQCVFVYIFPYEPIRFHNHPIQFSFRQQNGVQCRKFVFFFAQISAFISASSLASVERVGYLGDQLIFPDYPNRISFQQCARLKSRRKFYGIWGADNKNRNSSFLWMNGITGK